MKNPVSMTAITTLFFIFILNAGLRDCPNIYAANSKTDDGLITSAVVLDYPAFFSIDEIAASASDIVRVKIIDERTGLLGDGSVLPKEWEHIFADTPREHWPGAPEINTFNRAEVLKVYKGAAKTGDTLDIAQIGGRLGNREHINRSRITLNIGDDLVLFLHHPDKTRPARLMNPFDSVFRFTSSNRYSEIKNINDELKETYEYSNFAVTLDDLERISKTDYVRLNEEKISGRTEEIISSDIITDTDVLEFIPGIEGHTYPVSVQITYNNSYQEVLFPNYVFFSADNKYLLNVVWHGTIQPAGIGKTNIIAQNPTGFTEEREITIEQGSIERIDFEPNEMVLIRGETDGEFAYRSEISVFAYSDKGNKYNLTNNENLTLLSGNTSITGEMRGINTPSAGFALGETSIDVSIANATASLPVVACDVSEIESIRVFIDGLDSETAIPSDSAEKIKAYALLRDGREVDITPAVKWDADNSDILEAVDGYVFTHAEGEATVTAYFGDISGRRKITVAPKDEDPV